MSSFVGSFNGTWDELGNAIIDNNSVKISKTTPNTMPSYNGAASSESVNQNHSIPIGQGAVDRTNSSAVIASLINQIDEAVDDVKHVADNSANAVTAGQKVLNYVGKIFSTLNDLSRKIPEIQTTFQGTYAAVQTLKTTIETCKGKLDGTFDKAKNIVSSDTSLIQKLEGVGEVFSSGKESVACLSDIKTDGIALFNAWKTDKLKWETLTQTSLGGRNRRRKRSQLKRSRIKKTQRRKSKKRARNTRTH